MIDLFLSLSKIKRSLVLGDQVMSKKMLLPLALCIAFLTFVANFAIFVIAYHHTTKPFILEEQRQINADFIVSTVAPAFAGVAALIGGIVFWLTKPRPGHAALRDSP